MQIRIKNDLLLANILTVLLVIIAILLPSNVLRIILGLPFALFLPGYVLTAALFPRRDPLDNIERVALSFGLSTIVVPLVGLLLTNIPWGIKLYPVVISLAVFIMVTSVAAWYRRRKLAETDRFSISFSVSLTLWRGQGLVDKVLSIVLVAVILGAIGTTGYVLATPKVGEKFTEFYVVGLDGKIIEPPAELKVGEEGKVIVHIVNHEHEPVRYRVKVEIDGVSQGQIGPLELAHDESWEDIVSFIPGRAGDNQEVEFLLYKNEESGPYRKLRLPLKVEGSA